MHLSGHVSYLDVKAAKSWVSATAEVKLTRRVHLEYVNTQYIAAVITYFCLMWDRWDVSGAETNAMWSKVNLALRRASLMVTKLPECFGISPTPPFFSPPATTLFKMALMQHTAVGQGSCAALLDEQMAAFGPNKQILLLHVTWFKEQTSSLPSLIMGELWLYVFVEYTDPDTLQVCPSMDIDSAVVCLMPDSSVQQQLINNRFCGWTPVRILHWGCETWPELQNVDGAR